MFRASLFFILFFTFPPLAMGQETIKDWEFVVEEQGTSREKRSASTRARPFVEGEPGAILAVRRLDPDSLMDLEVTINPDVEAGKVCKYDNWELAIDSTIIPVKSFSTSPVSAILVAGSGMSEAEFWEPFVNGINLVIHVGRKCDGIFGDVNFESYTFSLRGSAAAHKFVLNEPEKEQPEE